MIAAASLDLEYSSLQQHGRVLTAHYASPPLNFVTLACIRDLDRLTAAVDRDRTVGAVVLTGGVAGRFMTHADPNELSAITETPFPPLPAAALLPFWRLTRTLLRLPGALRAVEGQEMTKALAWGYRWRRTIVRMNRSSTVYIAAINGPATGGGHELALACDLRYVSDAPAIRLGQVESLAALIPGGGGTQRLPNMIGTAHALEHMLDGSPLTAEQALALGLVNAVIPDNDLVTFAQEKAAQLARRAPVVVQTIKRLTYFPSTRPLPRGLDNELAGFVAAGLQPYMARARDAFAADLETLADSPLSTGQPDWVAGTRVDVTSKP